MKAGTLEKENKEPRQSRWGFDAFGQTYGPYAFGVASLLLIWFTIVAPELKLRAVNYESHMQILGTLKELQSSQENTAQSLKLTATILERAVERIGQ